MTREERLKVADILDDCPEVYQRIERLDGETMEEYKPFTKFFEALYAAVTVLREPNPCDNCYGPSLGIAHGYTDMRIKIPVHAHDVLEEIK